MVGAVFCAHCSRQVSHHNMATTATAAKISDRTTMRERRVSASIRCTISSAQGCAQPHSMPNIQMYRSREDRKYHSAPHMISFGCMSSKCGLQEMPCSEVEGGGECVREG